MGLKVLRNGSEKTKRTFFLTKKIDDFYEKLNRRISIIFCIAFHAF